MSESLLLTNVRPWGHATTDVLIIGGRIAQIGLGLAAPDPRTRKSAFPADSAAGTGGCTTLLG